MMSKPGPDPTTELLRDITAARADLRGRCDQLVAEYEERLSALESLGKEVEAGGVDARAAQARVRQLLNTSGGVSGVAARVGRGTGGVGLGPGAQKPAAPAPAPVKLAPTPTLVEASMGKSIQTLDLRIVAILSRACAPKERSEARMELSLLLALRRRLERHTKSDLPRDPVLLGSMNDYVDEAQAIIADLEAGEVARLLRLVEHARELTSQLATMGGAPPGLKEQLQKVKAQLGDKADAAAAEMVAAFARLQQELEKRFPLSTPSLLDELLRP